MNEEYLWNRAGEPDPETVRLEQLLGQLKYSGDAATRSLPRKKSQTVWWLAAAAALAAGILSLPIFMRGSLTHWKLADGRRLRTGQTIETDARRPARIRSDETGEITLDPRSRLRLLGATDREQRFDLRYGTLHAFIWAPPGRFVVNTPSSRTVDLGCRYTLRISESGAGMLTVELGWVAFERNKVESFIPAGAACVTRPDRGPGVPYFTDARKALTDALARFDTTGDPAALDAAIAASRPRDALSLWHLMARTRGEQRARVFDGFSTLVKLPPDVTREAILRGDAKAIDAAWNALDLGATEWWRAWKRPW